VLIGSLAEGGYTEESDVDLVWIVRGPLRRRWWREMELPSERRVQVIPLLLRGVAWHFARRTTLAHSIQRGLPIYDPEGRAAALQARPLALPDPEWMRGWFEHWQRFYEMGIWELRRARRWQRKYGNEHPGSVSDILARVAVNFAILLLETEGIVPTCKRALGEGFQRLTRGEKLRQAMETALEVHRQEREMRLEEVDLILYLLRWLHRRLRQALMP